MALLHLLPLVMVVFMKDMESRRNDWKRLKVHLDLLFGSFGLTFSMPLLLFLKRPGVNTACKILQKSRLQSILKSAEVLSI